MLKKVSHQEVAKFFITIANETGSYISNLKLQKLLYYAQAWHLAEFKTRLFEGDFRAWVHGPVLQESYHQFKEFGWKPILKEDIEPDYQKVFLNSLTQAQADLLNEVVLEYFGENAFELELMTHREEPWQKARIGLSPDAPSENIILDEWMIDYYSKFLVSGEEN